MNKQQPLAILFDVGLVLLHPDGNKISIALKDALNLHVDPFICYYAYPKTVYEHNLYNILDESDEWFWTTWCKYAGISTQLMSEVVDVIRRIEHSPERLWSVQDSGAHKTLQGLREAGIRLGAVSNAYGDTVYHLELAKLNHYFDGVVDSELVGVKKPDKQIFKLGLEIVQVKDPEACWFVGDNISHDIQPAISMGFGGVVHYDCLGLYQKASYTHYHITKLEELLALLK